MGRILHCQKTKRIVFRLDDICATMDMQKFVTMRDILDRYHIKPLLGIVPRNRDASLMVQEESPHYADIIKQCRLNGYAVAMHGTYHIYDSTAKGIVTKRPKSEFAGKSLKAQVRLLKAGKMQMKRDSLDTDIFFAPGHSYDKNTVRALRMTGFRVVSDGRSFGKYKRGGIEFIPVRIFATGLKPVCGITTICFHTNHMDHASFRRLEQYIAKYREYICDYSECFSLENRNTWISLTEEQIFVIYECYIHPFLRDVKKGLKGFLRGQP